jgi:tetrahydromethanopterin S-methyltransferase subunit G
MQRTCSRYWFEEEYVVYLHDNGYLLPASSTIAAASTTEVPELVEKIDSLEENLNNKVMKRVGKKREGMGSYICLVCGCVNVTIFLVLAIFLVVAVVLK